MTNQQKEAITLQLKKRNKIIWNDESVALVIHNLECVQEGIVKKTDYIIPNFLTYEDYFYQINLAQYL